jgi:hypothetical protein
VPRKVEIHWVEPERNRLGEIVKPGYHTQKQVWVPDPEPRPENVAGTVWTWIIAIAGLIFIFWVTSLFMDDGPAGKCQGELGYGGQVEYVECEPGE